MIRHVPVRAVTSNAIEAKVEVENKDVISSLTSRNNKCAESTQYLTLKCSTSSPFDHLKIESLLKVFL